MMVNHIGSQAVETQTSIETIRHNGKNVTCVIQDKLSLQDSVEGLLRYPTSIRMFDELFDNAKNALGADKNMVFVDRNTRKTVILHRRKNIHSDSISISFKDEGEDKSIVLRRELAHLSRKESHMSPRESIKKVLQLKLEPQSVTIYDKTRDGDLKDKQIFTHEY